MFQAVADWLFDPSNLTPHGFCLLWEPGLIWTHALADAIIGLAYYSIPLALAIFARRRRDLAFRPVFLLFAAFILLCGTVHWFDVLTLWVPVYGLQGALKVATALVSVVTGVMLWRLLPQALALPSPAQLRAANAALSASEARHRASFEHSPVPVHLLDGNGLLTAVSDSWLSWLGYRREEVIGRPVSTFLSPASASRVDGDLARLLDEGEARDVEQYFLREDGTLVDALVSSRLERRQDTVWVVAVSIDITARRRAEAALRASEERLHQAQKMEAVGQLTGGVAHDFNNMLQGIGGCLELMDRRIEQGRAGEARHYIDVARKSVDRAAGLTHRMLAFARRQALQPRVIQPDTLVLSMEELIRRTVGPGVSLSLRLQQAGRLPEAGGRQQVGPTLCDPNQLESALLNLAINARDAMPQGGTLTISTAERRMSWTDLTEQDEATPGDYVEIAVADTGTGMSPEVMARVFEPFFTTKPLGQGTGLGLSQLYGFVRQSGGLVRLASQPGKGTTVRLFLPRHQPDDPAGLSEASGAVRAEPARSAPVTGRVLVVEDDQTVRASVVEALSDIGCEVIEATDGPIGLRILQSGERLDILLSDVGLPGMNGRQLAEVTRKIRPELPILLMTGYAGTALDDTPPNEGFEVLRKPFTIEVLAAKVRAMLEMTLVR